VALLPLLALALFRRLGLLWRWRGLLRRCPALPSPKELFQRKALPRWDDGPFHLGELLAEGSFGQVRECSRRNLSAGPLDSSSSSSIAISCPLVVKVIRKAQHPLLQSAPSSRTSLSRRTSQLLMGCRNESLEEFSSYWSLVVGLRHPNIVRHQALLVDDSALYIVMERCSGASLVGHLLSEQNWREASVKPLVRQLLEALRHIHANGLVHRDVKLENLKISRESAGGGQGHFREGPGFRLRLLDFGLGCKVAAAKGAIGTLGYMAPEVFGSGIYSCRADLFSSGVVFYILLTGRPPFRAPVGASGLEEHREVLCEPIDRTQISLVQVSKEGLDLLDAMLMPMAPSRATAQESLQHPWFWRQLGSRPCRRKGGQLGPVLWSASDSELRFLEVMGVWVGESPRSRRRSLSRLPSFSSSTGEEVPLTPITEVEKESDVSSPRSSRSRSSSWGQREAGESPHSQC
ncbi:unnamed protein product, partial [Polarella glacialis]